jgi:hypothetical protein
MFRLCLCVRRYYLRAFTLYNCTAIRGCYDSYIVGDGGGDTVASNAQNGLTALLLAAQKGHADCVRLLLDAGADANAKGVGVRLE